MKIFKKLLLVLFVISLFVLSSCTLNDDETKISVIMPTGTPSLALANFAVESKDVEVDIVAGSDLLVAAFNQQDKDIIVAPVNLGARFYQLNGAYLLYKTFVWGNLYVASKTNITSLEDLNNKEVVVFGKNSTPDIVFNSLLKYYDNLHVDITYVNDVSEANTLLASNQAEIIISAEPSLSKIKDNLGLYVIDLQEEWEKMTSDSSYPQAGIFIKKSLINDNKIKIVLNQMTSSINKTISNPKESSENAVKFHSSFATLGASTLEKAIPNCHYLIKENEKESVLYYLEQMMELGFAAQIGGKLPDEGFFI